MSYAITADDVEAELLEASAATLKSRSAVSKDVTILSVAAQIWTSARKLESLVKLFAEVDFRAVSGLSCQHLEKGLTKLILTLDDFWDLCQRKRLFNLTLTGAPLQSMGLRLEELKDVWVMFSASTDADLDDALKAAKSEESLDWYSIRR